MPFYAYNDGDPVNHDLARLHRANHILANSDYGPVSTRPDGSHARYQIFFSEDLWTATPLTNSDGSPRMEYICPCGIDRTIHSPDCRGLSIASVKFMRTKTDPFLHNVFTLCVWLPPPSEKSWSDLYGSFRYYPREGRYVPLSINGNYLKLPYPPFEETARKIVQMIRDHNENKEQREEEALRKLELREMQKTPGVTPPPNSKFQNNRLRLKDRMTLLGHKPGGKGVVSYSGIPLINRPNALTESQLPSNPSYAAEPTPAPLIRVAS